MSIERQTEMLEDTYKVSLEELMDFLRGYLPPMKEGSGELHLNEYTFIRAHTFYNAGTELGSFWTCTRPDLRIFAPFCLGIEGWKTVNVVQRHPEGIPTPIEDATPTATLITGDEITNYECDCTDFDGCEVLKFYSGSNRPPRGLHCKKGNRPHDL